MAGATSAAATSVSSSRVWLCGRRH